MSKTNNKSFFKTLIKILKFFVLAIIKLGLYAPIIYVLIGVVVNQVGKINLLDFSLGSTIYISGFFACCMFSILITIWNIYQFFANSKTRKELKKTKKEELKLEEEKQQNEQTNDFGFVNPPPKVKEKKKRKDKKKEKEEMEEPTIYTKNYDDKLNVGFIDSSEYTNNYSFNNIERNETNVQSQTIYSISEDIVNKNSLGREEKKNLDVDDYINRINNNNSDNSLNILSKAHVDNFDIEDYGRYINNISNESNSITHDNINKTNEQKNTSSININNNTPNITNENIFTEPKRKPQGLTDEERMAILEEFDRIENRNSSKPNSGNNKNKTAVKVYNQPKVYNSNDNPNIVISEYEDKYVYYKHVGNELKYIGEKKKDAN